MCVGLSHIDWDLNEDVVLAEVSLDHRLGPNVIPECGHVDAYARATWVFIGEGQSGDGFTLIAQEWEECF